MDGDFPAGAGDDAGVAAELEVGGLEDGAEVVGEAVEGDGGEVWGVGAGADAVVAVVVQVRDGGLSGHEREGELQKP